MKTLFPAAIVDIISNSIDFNLDLKSEVSKMKAKHICYDLWYFIYNKQIDNNLSKELKGEFSSLETYVNIHSNEFKPYRTKYNNISYHYDYFLSILEEFNLIEINNKYSSDNFSKSYRILTSFIDGDFTEIDIDFDKIFGEFKTKSYWIKIYPKYEKLIKDCYRAKVDLSNYVKFLYDNKGKTIAKLGTKFIINNKGDKFKVLCDRILDNKRILNYINEAIKINIGNLWFKISEEGRFYSSITNLSHISNYFLLINRQKLIGLDIRNAQPLFLSMILNNKSFKDACEEGRFYQDIMNKLGWDKTRVKIACYRYIFFNNELTKKGKLMTVIEELYPNLVNQINALKTLGNLPSMLQKIESEIVIDGIASLDIPMITKHDQIFVTDQYLKDVNECLSHLMEVKGVKVKLKQDKDKDKLLLFI